MSETTPETGAPDPERKGPYWKGYEKGYEEGKAEAGYDRGYHEGYEEAKRQLTLQHRPPLFEACKRAAREPLSAKQLESAIAALEHEYGTLLNKADRDLILGLGRRTRLAAQTGTRRPVPTVSHDTGKQPAETAADTDYELVQ